MTPRELIAAVAVEHLRRQLEREPHGTLRFCMVGLNLELASAIAAAVAASPDLEQVEVRIPESLATEALDPALVSSEAAVHWRHSLPETPGKRALLIAIDAAELQRSQGSVAGLPRLDTATLRRLDDEWLIASSLSDRLSDGEKKRLVAILDAVESSQLPRTIEMLGDFVARLADAVIRGTCASLEHAAQRALPALHLPRDAYAFVTGSRRTQDNVNVLARTLRQRAEELHPLLGKRTEKGEMLNEQELLANLAELKECRIIAPDAAEIVERFLRDVSITPDTWRKTQADLCELQWQVIAPVFESSDTSQPKTLGEETIAFFEAEFPGVIDEDESLLLERVPANSKATPEIVDFFHAHRGEIALSRDIRQYKNLASRWERLVFKKPEVFEGFLEGTVATMQRLVERATDMPQDPVFVVELKDAEKESFWLERRNTRLGRFFRQRYHGIQKVFGETVVFKLGRMTSHPLEMLEDSCTSQSKAATEFKFEMFLVGRRELSDTSARRQAPTAQFIWTLPPDAIAVSLPDDLQELTRGDEVLLASATVTREPVSTKGEIQQVRLAARTTLRDAHDRSDGRLVNSNSSTCTLYPQLTAAIEGLRGDGILDSQQAAKVREALTAFRDTYSTALRAWVDPHGEGIAAPELIRQAELYGRLLEVLREVAFRDNCRKQLWEPILSIGVAAVTTGGRAAIVAPWHPLRLAEISAKARQAATIARRIVESPYEELDGADLFFDQMRRNMATPYYPEVCLSREPPALLALTSHLADYSLMEPPTRGGNGSAEEEEEALDAEAQAAARQFAAVSEQYLELQPHERANFSVVLYNAEAKDLPSALADELGSRVERDEDLRCDLLVTHDDPVRTRRIYEQQNAAIGDDAETILSSEAARNFLSRLRVGFIEADAFNRSSEHAATDIVFLQDVVARNARLGWMAAPFGEPANLEDHRPSQWSRRRPVARGDQTAAVYLAAPLQPHAGQAYLDALETMAEAREPEKDRHWLPVRRVAFDDSGMGRVLERAHGIGDWVASYDALADRRLYRNRDIQIIRYVNNRDTNRGLVVSTNRPPKLLLGVLEKRLGRILPHADPALGRELAGCLVNQALELSGQIVLRAARHGHFAGELMGVVLSMMQVRGLLRAENDRHIGWFFLDDFASWFGQREGQIADTLALNPSLVDGAPVLNMVVVESKFVGSEGHQQYAKKSASQLIETTTRIAKAIDPQRRRIDRRVWLDRLADLMLEGMEPFSDAPVAGWDLNEWSREIREDKVAVRLLGLSHVFIHEDDASVASRTEPLRRGETPYLQQIFNLDDTRCLLETARARKAELTDHQRDELWKSSILSSPKHAPSEAPRRRHDEPGGRSIVQPRADEASAPAATAAAEPAATTETDIATQPSVISAEAAGAFPPPVQACVAVVDQETEADADREWLDNTVVKLQQSLRSYEMSSEVLGSRLTPNAALVRFRGTDELTVTKVEKKRQQLLTSHALEVINVLAAPGQIIIMVRRPHRAVLSLRSLWKRRRLPSTAPQLNTSLLLGAKEADGELLYLNIGDDFAGQPQHAPHTLVAGETGSGKGVLVQNLLLDICATNAPSLAQIQMIDPKAGVDYPWLRRMPHLVGELITDRDAAVAAFEALVEEMERRYELIARTHVSKLAQYNKKVRPDQRLPMLWLFHDEMADWMLLDDYRDAVGTSVTRLSSKARAAGISIVLITQRPDKDAVPPLVRANIGNRLVLKVSDRRNSELVLDQPIAARLLGKGHLAAKLSGENEIKLAQVPFADEAELAQLADAIVTSWTSHGAKS